MTQRHQEIVTLFLLDSCLTKNSFELEASLTMCPRHVETELPLGSGKSAAQSQGALRANASAGEIQAYGHAQKDAASSKAVY